MSFDVNCSRANEGSGALANLGSWNSTKVNGVNSEDRRHGLCRVAQSGHRLLMVAGWTEVEERG